MSEYMDRFAEEPPKVNVELLTRTLDYIVAHPKEWDQEVWHCGSTHCFAGHGALLDGATIVPPSLFLSFMMRRKNGTVAHTREVAQDAFGLTDGEASQLFSVDNTLADLIDMVESFALIVELDPKVNR